MDLETDVGGLKADAKGVPEVSVRTSENGSCSLCQNMSHFLRYLKSGPGIVTFEGCPNTTIHGTTRRSAEKRPGVLRACLGGLFGAAVRPGSPRQVVSGMCKVRMFVGVFFCQRW